MESLYILNNGEKMEYIDVVDENNNFVGKVVSKEDVHKKGFFYREVIGIIVNEKNEVLLQKRASSKKEYPNKWELCYGHVSSGESPITAMKRELFEENGLEVLEKDLIFLSIEKTVESNLENARFHKVFSYIYLSKTTNKITDYIFQKEEVSSGKYISINELKQLFLNNDESLAFLNSKNFINRLEKIENILSRRDKMKAIDRLINKIKETDNPTVMGLDPRYEMLPECIKSKYGTDIKSVCEASWEYNKALIDSTCDIIPAIKPQSAFYECLGTEGIELLRKTCSYAKEKGMIVILDAKRGDIGSTSSGYSSAYLGKTKIQENEYSLFDVDFLTVNPYLGIDGIKPFIEDCKKYDKGLFILVRTSNPSSNELQTLKLENGKTVYEHIGELVNYWGEELIGDSLYSSVAAVVGATRPEELEVLRDKFPNMFFLVPGYGAQRRKSRRYSFRF